MICYGIIIKNRYNTLAEMLLIYHAVASSACILSHTYFVFTKHKQHQLPRMEIHFTSNVSFTTNATQIVNYSGYISFIPPHFFRWYPFSMCWCDLWFSCIDQWFSCIACTQFVLEPFLSILIWLFDFSSVHAFPSNWTHDLGVASVMLHTLKTKTGLWK